MGFYTLLAIAFLVGVLVFFLPTAAAPMLPKRMRRFYSGSYISLAMQAGEKVLLARKKLGGHSLVTTSYDPDKEAQEAEPEGEVGHFDDPHRFMSRCKNKPFGVVYGRFNAIVTPMFAEIGEIFSQWLENDTHKVDITPTDIEASDVDIDPDHTHRAYNRAITVPEDDRGVDMAEITYIMPAHTRPTDGETSYEYVKMSQIGFNKRRAVEAMAIITSFAAGFGLVALALYQFGTGGGGVSGVNIPIHILLGVVA